MKHSRDPIDEQKSARGRSGLWRAISRAASYLAAGWIVVLLVVGVMDLTFVMDNFFWLATPGLLGLILLGASGVVSEARFRRRLRLGRISNQYEAGGGDHDSESTMPDPGSRQETTQARRLQAWLIGLSLGVLAIVLVVRIMISFRGEGLLGSAIPIVAGALAVVLGGVLPTIITNLRMTRRLRQIKSANPGAFLLPVLRSVELVRVIRESNPGATIDRELVLAVRDRTIRILSGARVSVEIASIVVPRGVEPKIGIANNDARQLVSSIDIYGEVAGRATTLAVLPRNRGWAVLMPAGRRRADHEVRLLTSALVGARTASAP